jgi:hypothetical protein
MDQNKLNEILIEHGKWLNDPTTGKRANLENANLRDANLRYANLRFADLRYADLRLVDLRNADLRNADLKGANLRFAKLKDTNPRSANLINVDLTDADLTHADLRYTNLANATPHNHPNTMYECKDCYDIVEEEVTGEYTICPACGKVCVPMLCLCDGILGKKCCKNGL